MSAKPKRPKNEDKPFMCDLCATAFTEAEWYDVRDCCEACGAEMCGECMDSHVTECVS